MPKGIIIKALSGFYYVDTGENVYECRAKGIFRGKISPCVGDKVEIAKTEQGKGHIMEIHPRRNYLIRPSLANIDQLVMVASIADPVTSTLVLDKIIAICEYEDITPVIVISKSDLADITSLEQTYKNAGFPVFAVNNISKAGVLAVKDILAGKVSGFCGNSGVGKSSLLNAIDERFMIKTDITSQKLGRGKHTTRHVELYSLDNGGFVADTPGFSSIEHTIPKDKLQLCFTEFNKYFGECQFRNCSHTAEKGCAILEALKCGDISKTRHESYVNMWRQK